MYVVLHPDEDGNTAELIDEEYLYKILNDQYIGPVNILTEEDLKCKGPEPQYWDTVPAMDILILKIEKVVAVEPVVTKWRIKT